MDFVFNNMKLDVMSCHHCFHCTMNEAENIHPFLLMSMWEDSG